MNWYSMLTIIAFEKVRYYNVVFGIRLSKRFMYILKCDWIFFLAIMQLWLSNRIRKTVLIPFISFTGKSLIIIKKLSFITRWVPLHSFKKVLWIDTKRIVNDHRLHVFTLVYIYTCIWLTVTCLPWRIILMCYYLFIFFQIDSL